jgi:hypothetical protein
MEQLPAPRAEHAEVNEKLMVLLEALRKLHATGHKPLYFDIYPIDVEDPRAGYTVDGWEP